MPTPAGLATLLDEPRIAVGRTEALAAVAVESYDRADWPGADPLRVERLAYLLGAAAEAAAAAVAADDRFRALVADQQPSESDDTWDER